MSESGQESYQRVDEVTLAKLEILSGYLQEWLSMPLSGQMHVDEAVIHDLICGHGETPAELNGSASPLIAADVVRANSEKILRNSRLLVRLLCNDTDCDSVSQLRNRLGTAITDPNGQRLACVDYYNRPLVQLFEELLVQLRARRTANFVLLDQFGTGELDATRFRSLHKLERTDVLIFLDPNWFGEFSESQEAEKWGISGEDLDRVDYNHIHRFMVAYFKKLIGDDYYVAPFSLKRGSKLHGLIFASHLPLRLEKFLNVAWRLDPYTGDANLDLYDERLSPSQLSLLDAHKVSSFQKLLFRCLECGRFASDREIYLYVLQRGFLRRHATEIVTAYCRRFGARFRAKDGRLGQPRLSRACLNEPRPLVHT